MTESIKITSRGIVNGKMLLSDSARERLYKFLKMDEGNWLLTRTKDKDYKKTRYKYLFACVYLTAVTDFNRRGMFQIHIEETGEVLPLTVEDLHEMMKQYFNPIIVKYEGMRIIKGGSTKKLSDSEFINEFLEKVYQWLSDHDVIVKSYSEWRELAEQGYTSEEIIEENIS